MTRQRPRLRHCSFCDASEHKVRLLIGSDPFICDKCVGECSRTLAGVSPTDPGPTPEVA